MLRNVNEVWTYTILNVNTCSGLFTLVVVVAAAAVVALLV
jgi:hypothetical protein